jgi:hypothetical protein
MYYKGSFMNIKMLKAAVAGLVLSVSGFANAGLITTIELDTATTGLNYNFDTVVWEWSTAISAGTTNTSDIVNLSMALYFGSNVVFQDVIIQNSIAQNHVGYPRVLGDIDWSFDFSSMTLIDFDNYGPYANLNGQNPYTTMNVYGDNGIFRATPSSDYTSNYVTTNFTQSTVNSVPEPSTLAIFALGLMGLASRRFKKQ